MPRGGDGISGSGRAVIVVPLILLVLDPRVQRFEGRGPAFAQAVGAGGRDRNSGAHSWPFRRNTGLEGASWAARMRPSCRTVSRPSSPSRTSTAAPA